MPESLLILLEYLEHERNQFGSLAGWGRELLDFTLLYPGAMTLLWIVFGFLYVYLHEWQLPWNSAASHSIAVVVPAHNEEALIEQTIQSLLNQDYARMQIHVVSDGSTDMTVEIARRYENWNVVVHDLQPNRGKSHALQYILERTDADLFLIVDADTVAAPRAVSFLVQQFANPQVGAVTGGIKARNVHSLLTAMQAMEYAVIVSLAKRAEQFWGGLYTVSGAAACFRTDSLKHVGGWNGWTATEDIEMSWRLQKSGYRIAFEPRAEFAVQTPSSLIALYRQRSRWAQGMTEVLREHWNLAWARNAALLPIAVQVAATALWMTLTLILLVYTVAMIIAGKLSWNMAFTQTGSELLPVFYWTVGLFMLQALTAIAIEGAYGRCSIFLWPLALFYPVYYWAVIFPTFVLGAWRGLWSHHSTRWIHTLRVENSNRRGAD